MQKPRQNTESAEKTGKVKETPKKPVAKVRGAAALGAGPGRPKGSQNKNTAAIKDMVVQALGKAGGVAYLVKRANDPKTASAFLGLVGKVLPTQLTGPGDGPIQFTEIRRVIVGPGA